MIFSENFWDVRLVDFFPLITAIISPILIYWIYKKLDNSKEKARLKALFIRIRRMLENYLPDKKDSVNKPFFEAHLPFLATQKEHLIKIGVIMGHTTDEKIKGNIVSKTTSREPKFEVDLKTELKIPTLYIVDKYIMGGVTIQVVGKKFDINQENINKILDEMRKYSKKYYGYKFKNKNTTINYHSPIKRFFKFLRLKFKRTKLEYIERS